jgi:hypothetical protein
MRLLLENLIVKTPKQEENRKAFLGGVSRKIELPLNDE